MGSISLASIEAHFALLPSPKKEELCALYEIISEEMKSEPISFFDGKNENGKTIANPTIGFGETMLQYANGKKREIFRIGICATASGLSIHILGITDKTFLKNFLGDRLGKVKITGYCIQFKKMKDIDREVLKSLLRLIRDPEKS